MPRPKMECYGHRMLQPSIAIYFTENYLLNLSPPLMFIVLKVSIHNKKDGYKKS